MVAMKLFIAPLLLLATIVVAKPMPITVGIVNGTNISAATISLFPLASPGHHVPGINIPLNANVVYPSPTTVGPSPDSGYQSFATDQGLTAILNIAGDNMTSSNSAIFFANSTSVFGDDTTPVITSLPIQTPTESSVPDPGNVLVGHDPGNDPESHVHKNYAAAIGLFYASLAIFIIGLILFVEKRRIVNAWERLRDRYRQRRLNAEQQRAAAVLVSDPAPADPGQNQSPIELNLIGRATTTDTTGEGQHSANAGTSPPRPPRPTRARDVESPLGPIAEADSEAGNPRCWTPLGNSFEIGNSTSVWSEPGGHSGPGIAPGTSLMAPRPAVPHQAHVQGRGNGDNASRSIPAQDNLRPEQRELQANGIQFTDWCH